MPSPFPGMNPYLEQDILWQDFRINFLAAIKERLVPQAIPLRHPDGNARIDLQEVLHHVYDASGYEDFIYTSPPDPPLEPEDAAWARQIAPTGA
jgi:hypothetical protein